MKELIPEIEELGNWLGEFAGDLRMTDEEITRLSDAACYLHILKQLVRICPEELLAKIRP